MRRDAEVSRENAALRIGRQADALFALRCSKAGLDVELATMAPLMNMALAEATKCPIRYYSPLNCCK